jgi:hypothetical protein
MEATDNSYPDHTPEELEKLDIPPTVNKNPHLPSDTLAEIRWLLERAIKEESPAILGCFETKKYSGVLEIIAYPNFGGQGSVSLLFSGWEIVLNPDGTYFWSDTTGG